MPTPIDHDSMTEVIAVMKSLNALDERMMVDDWTTYITGTIEIHNKNGYKVGEVRWQDDFWVFVAAEVDER